MYGFCPTFLLSRLFVACVSWFRSGQLVVSADQLQEATWHGVVRASGAGFSSGSDLFLRAVPWNSYLLLLWITPMLLKRLCRYVRFSLISEYVDGEYRNYTERCDLNHLGGTRCILLVLDRDVAASSPGCAAEPEITMFWRSQDCALFVSDRPGR